MTKTCQLGVYPTDGIVMQPGAVWQTARIDNAGAYDATNGVVIGDAIRSGPWRLYGGTNDLENDTIFQPGSDEKKTFDAGHVPIFSFGGGQYSGSGTWYSAMAGGYQDANLKKMFARVHALDFGGAVVPIATTTGSKLPIPGSTKKGIKPSEVVIVMSHEPNIKPFGSQADYAGMYKHVMQLYDTWRGGGTKRIKFATIISNPGNNVTSVCNGWYQVSNSNDISKTGARQVDYFGWDIYFPQVEKGNGPVKPFGTPGGAVYFGSKFNALHNWTVANSAANTYEIIGEIACRIETAASGGTAIDATWPTKFWTDATNGFVAWNTGHTLANGDHPLRYVCQYASMDLIKTGTQYNNGLSGSIDNAITADCKTYDAAFQAGGYSLREAFKGWRAAKVALGDETMTGTAGTVPAAPTNPTPPTAGQTSTVLSFAVPVADVAVNLYESGVAVAGAQGLTGTSVTVQANSKLPLPQTKSYTLKGVGTDNNETAASSALSVTFLAAVVTPPSAPSAPTVTSVGIDSATFTVPAVPTATGYTWFLDSNTTTPDFNSTGPTVPATGISTGSHTVKAKAFNTGGASGLSAASSSFTMATAPDTTAPSVPTGLAAVASASSVLLGWSPSTDTVVAGAVTSGMGTYVVARSNSAQAGSGTILSGDGQTGVTFTDASPPSSVSAPVTVYYFVAAVDNAGNQSAWSTALSVVIPQATTGTDPTAVLSVPSTGTAGQGFTIDLSQSLPGSDAITGYTFEVSWNGQLILSVGPQAAPSTSIRLTAPRQYSITGTVTDAASRANSTTATIVIEPVDGPTFAFTGGNKVVSGAAPSASALNGTFQSFDDAALSASARLDDAETKLTLIGDPLTPRRHGGALWMSINPESVGSELTIVPGTVYAVRGMTLDTAPLTSVHWVQTNASAAGAANAWWALYDVSGALMSSTTATNCASSWNAQGEQTYTLDGGPYDLPLGADITNDPANPPTNEFFLAFSIASATTAPHIACGATQFSAAINIGTSTGTPTQATISTSPVFSTAANGQVGTLQPPLTLGVLTKIGASMLVAAYP